MVTLSHLLNNMTQGPGFIGMEVEHMTLFVVQGLLVVVACCLHDEMYILW